MRRRLASPISVCRMQMPWDMPPAGVCGILRRPFDAPVVAFLLKGRCQDAEKYMFLLSYSMRCAPVCYGFMSFPAL